MICMHTVQENSITSMFIVCYMNMIELDDVLMWITANSR
jgi:hypothetical protein